MVNQGSRYGQHQARHIDVRRVGPPVIHARQIARSENMYLLPHGKRQMQHGLSGRWAAVFDPAGCMYCGTFSEWHARS